MSALPSSVASDQTRYLLDQLGIADFDAYHIMWYGNYAKWIRRAVHFFLRNFGTGVLSPQQPIKLSVDHIRYKKPLRWGEGGSVPCVTVDALDEQTILVRVWSGVCGSYKHVKWERGTRRPRVVC